VAAEADREVAEVVAAVPSAAAEEDSVAAPLAVAVSAAEL
jgi:hypothetical protein